MPRRPSADPMVTLSLKITSSFRQALLAEADGSGQSLSDAIRQRLASTEAPVRGTRAPRRRKLSELGPVSKADPALLRQLAAIGSNMNQLARSANAGALAGSPVAAAAILAHLVVIERALGDLSAALDERVPERKPL